MTRFFKLTANMAEFLRNNLSHSEWKLWSYFVTLDPFGSKYLEIPPLVNILMECGISERTFYRAIAKFKELDLFDFQYVKAYIRNLNGSDTDGSETVMGGSETVMGGSETVMGGSPSIYKEFKNIQTLSDKKSENEEKTPETETTANCVVIEVNQDSSDQPINSGNDKFFERRTIKPAQYSFDWLPDGPWAIEGKLDPNFRDWLAHAWLSQYGGDIHQRRADVLAHFKKDPANLPIRWEQYQSEFLHRFENAQILLNNGVAIPEMSQDKLMANQRAITQSLPQEMNPCAQRALGIAPSPNATVEPLPITQGIVVSAKPQVNSYGAAKPHAPAADYVKNEDGHILKVFKAPATPKEEEQITPEQWEEAKAKLQGFLGKFGKSRPSAAPSKGVTESTQQAITQEAVAKKQEYFEELNHWIQDPLLRDEAVKRVKASDCYQCLVDEAGIPYQIIWCEEF